MQAHVFRSGTYSHPTFSFPVTLSIPLHDMKISHDNSDWSGVNELLLKIHDEVKDNIFFTSEEQGKVEFAGPSSLVNKILSKKCSFAIS